MFLIWKGFNTQHCLLAMVEKCRKTLDRCGETGAVLSELPKESDYTGHNLIIAKLSVYRFERQLIDFIYSYLTKRKQRTKVNPAVSLMGNPQEMIVC